MVDKSAAVATRANTPPAAATSKKIAEALRTLIGPATDALLEIMADTTVSPGVRVQAATGVLRLAAELLASESAVSDQPVTRVVMIDRGTAAAEIQRRMAIGER